MFRLEIWPSWSALRRKPNRRLTVDSQLAPKLTLAPPRSVATSGFLPHGEWYSSCNFKRGPVPKELGRIGLPRPLLSGTRPYARSSCGNVREEIKKPNFHFITKQTVSQSSTKLF